MKVIGIATAVALCASSNACVEPTATPDARPSPIADGPTGEPTATIGRCELPSGDACVGSADEQGTYVALVDGDDVSMVVGPQGATMFSLSLRTTGMYPGDPTNPASTDNPEVGIVVTRDGLELAHYRGRPAFALDDTSQQLTAPALFVIVEASAFSLDGQLVDASTTIRDRDGVLRWGRVKIRAQLP